MTYLITFLSDIDLGLKSHKYFDTVFIKGKHMWRISKQFILVLLVDFSIDKLKKEIYIFVVYVDVIFSSYLQFQILV